MEFTQEHLVLTQSTTSKSGTLPQPFKLSFCEYEGNASFLYSDAITQKVLLLIMYLYCYMFTELFVYVVLIGKSYN